MDDLCVISKNFDDHLDSLKDVFHCLRRHGLKIKAKKCHFATDQVVWLGHKVTREGVSPDTEKVTAVCKWDVLQDKKEVQQFLGICGWWRKFIPQFAQLAKPLYHMLQKDKFEWNSETETAFTKLKRCLTAAPVLAHPDPDKQFIVHTDASDAAVGGALLQQDSRGTLHPLAYFSQTLSKRERGCSTFDREAIAIRDTIKHF